MSEYYNVNGLYILLGRKPTRENIVTEGLVPGLESRILKVNPPVIDNSLNFFQRRGYHFLIFDIGNEPEDKGSSLTSNSLYAAIQASYLIQSLREDVYRAEQDYLPTIALVGNGFLTCHLHIDSEKMGFSLLRVNYTLRDVKVNLKDIETKELDHEEILIRRSA